MVKPELVLEPYEADLVLRAVERAREVQATQPEQVAQTAGDCAETWPSRADGAVRLAESFLAGHPAKGSGGERFQVMVHLEQEPLAPDGEWAATLEDGTRVSAPSGTLRRVACHCALVVSAGRWMHEWAEERDLDFPEWGGSKPDYDLAVSGLLEAT
jgi:hypothetical protein